MSRRQIFLLWMGLACTVAPGCAMMTGGRNWFTGKMTDQSEPAAADKWAFVGQEARGNRRMEKEDPLDKWLWSDQAREINRNVGFQ